MDALERCEDGEPVDVELDFTQKDDVEVVGDLGVVRVTADEVEEGEEFGIGLLAC